jgi:hypothetical protein
MVLSLQIFQAVAPEAPEVWDAAGGFELVVVDEEEVVRPLSYPSKGSVEAFGLTLRQKMSPGIPRGTRATFNKGFRERWR